jgi:hypothetical protein
MTAPPGHAARKTLCAGPAVRAMAKDQPALVAAVNKGDRMGRASKLDAADGVDLPAAEVAEADLVGRSDRVHREKHRPSMTYAQFRRPTKRPSQTRRRPPTTRLL